MFLETTMGYIYIIHVHEHYIKERKLIALFIHCVF